MDETSLTASCERHAARLLKGEPTESLSTVRLPPPSPSEESSIISLIMAVLGGVVAAVAARLGGFMLQRKFAEKNGQVGNASQAGAII
jgi:hypothetical protein